MPELTENVLFLQRLYEFLLILVGDQIAAGAVAAFFQVVLRKAGMHMFPESSPIVFCLTEFHRRGRFLFSGHLIRQRIQLLYQFVNRFYIFHCLFSSHLCLESPALACAEQTLHHIILRSRAAELHRTVFFHDLEDLEPGSIGLLHVLPAHGDVG